MRALITLLLTLGVCAPAAAQETWNYRVRFQAENSSGRTNERSPVRPTDPWTTSQLFVLSGDSTWTPHDWIRLAASASGIADGSGDVDLRLREGYVRAGLASWLDVEAGKRTVRWGVGYGFAPAGVLDPPRRAVDPTDRLQLNEGITLLKADVYTADSTFTIAAGDGLAAARFGRILKGGVEIGAIAAAERQAAPRYAATVTHVVGQQLELHGEVLSHDHEGSRAISAAAGVQYTFTAGVNLVVEYHRNGRGLTDDRWDEVRRGARPAGAVSRRHAIFVRAARAGTGLVLAPEAIVILNPEDGGWTVVPSLTWMPQQHLQLYVRATRLWGASGSMARFAPTSATITAGGGIRW